MDQITYQMASFGHLGNIADMGTKFTSAQQEINQVFHALTQVWDSQARGALSAAQLKINDELEELMRQFMQHQDNATEQHNLMHRTDGGLADGFGGSYS